MTQRCRVSSNFNLACRGSSGRLASLTLMLRLCRPAIGSPLVVFEHDLFGKPVSTFPDHALVCLGNKRSRRHVAVDIGMIQRIELNPKHVGLENQGVADRLALRRRLRM